MIKQLTLAIAIAAFVTGCHAEDTKKPSGFTTNIPIPLVIRDTNGLWKVMPKPADMPGFQPPWSVFVRRLTNNEILHVEAQWTNGLAIWHQTEFKEKVYLSPVQITQWFNEESNVWEMIEVPLIQTPKLVLETLRTNLVGRKP